MTLLQSRRRRAALCGGALFAIAVATLECCALSANAGDWPHWLGPTRNGVSTEIIKAWEKPPLVLWKQPVGSGFSSPVFADGKLFVHAQVPNKDAEEVIAIDGKSGEVAWRDSYEREAYRSALGAGPRATPTFDNGHLYTFGIRGALSCYDGKSGKRIWQVHPFAELKATMPNFGVCSSPVVVRGKVVIPVGGPNSAVVAYDAATGALAWSRFDEPASSASAVVLNFGPGADARTDVVVQTTLRVIGLNPDDGSVRWEHPLVFQPNGVSPTPLVSGNYLICTTQDTGTMALKFAGADSTANPESPWWQHAWTSYFSTGAVGKDDRLYLVTNAAMPLPRADIRCIEIASGKELWQKQGLGYFHVGVIVTGDGKLLLLDDGGNLTLADVADGYKQLARSKVCGGSFPNPVLADGRVYVRDAKEAICLQLAP